MRWKMGTDATKVDAYIENEDGNAVISLTRLTKPGCKSIRLPTDAEWQSIIDCIGAAPKMLDALCDAKEELIELYEIVYRNDESDNETTKTIDKVIKAINKATGGRRGTRAK